MFHSNAPEPEQHQPANDAHEPQDTTQSNSNDTVSVLIAPSSSNNILNSSLSGSFQKCRPKTIADAATPPNANDQIDDDDDDDDECIDAIESSNTIYASPISRSQPQFLQPPVGSTEREPGTSHQRIAVAAIPNVNFAHSSMSRAVSSSSPSVYVSSSQQHDQRNAIDSSGNNSDSSDDNRRIGNFKRAAATSSDYFV